MAPFKDLPDPLHARHGFGKHRKPPSTEQSRHQCEHTHLFAQTMHEKHDLEQMWVAKWPADDLQLLTG